MSVVCRAKKTTSPPKRLSVVTVVASPPFYAPRRSRCYCLPQSSVDFGARLLRRAPPKRSYRDRPAGKNVGGATRQQLLFICFFLVFLRVLAPSSSDVFNISYNYSNRAKSSLYGPKLNCSRMPSHHHLVAFWGGAARASNVAFGVHTMDKLRVPACMCILLRATTAVLIFVYHSVVTLITIWRW